MIEDSLIKIKIKNNNINSNTELIALFSELNAHIFTVKIDLLIIELIH